MLNTSNITTGIVKKEGKWWHWERTAQMLRYLISCGTRPIRHKYRGQLCLEILEDRFLLSTFIVNTTSASGPGSLFQAIVDSNNTAGPNTINFAINSGLQTIQNAVGTVAVPLPPITTPVTVNGTTQPGFNGNPLIVLSTEPGTAAPDYGLDVQVNDCTIEGLVINGFVAENLLVESNGNLVQGNFIGTDPMGSAAVGAGGGVGILINGANNTIGGTIGAWRNIISGNGEAGILIAPGGFSGNVIQGNYIGIDVTGTIAVPNRLGIVTSGDSETTIGGSAVGAGNVVSGNVDEGLDLANSAGDVVQGNKIGTNASGSLGLPNGGIGVVSGTSTTIGGSSVGAGNVISANGNAGVELLEVRNNLVQGNLIGTDSGGTNGLGNAGNGILLLDSADNAINSNVVAGNGATGVTVSYNESSLNGLVASGNVLQGNKIGTNAEGSAALPNQGDGIDISGAIANLIGGSALGQGNLISGNAGVGIALTLNGRNGSQPSGNLIQGNEIGTDGAGVAAIPNLLDGIYFAGASGNTVGGTAAGAGNVISGNAVFGVLLAGYPVGTSLTASSNNVLEDNLIGLSAGGGTLGNANCGVTLFPGATDNTIGGSVPGAGNVISGNLMGISLAGTGTSGNVVQGNRIGTDASGTSREDNVLDGVVVSAGASGNTLGGNPAGAGNTISGNARFGVVLDGVDTSGNVVQGNLIGTSASGTAALGNVANGISIGTATDNTIGGTLTGSGNTIAGNGFFGILFSGGGAAGNNVVQGNFIGTNATGTAALANGQDGVELLAASDNTIGGTSAGAGNVVSGNGLFGIFIFGANSSGNVLMGNRIGTNAAGTSAVPNTFDGVAVFSGGADNTIGGTAAGAGNVLSGNDRFGVYFNGTGTSGNVVQGNRIGLNSAGAVLGNTFDGVALFSGAADNTIGGTASGAGNTIAGNGRYGVTLVVTGTSNNLIQGNFIGTDASGTLAGGQGSAGVFLASGAADNTLGGTVSGAGNVIANNGGPGVLIGTSVSDNATVGDAVLGNAIFGNGGVTGLGIDLANDGVTANGAAGVARSGPNDLQNHPVFTPAAATMTNNTASATLSFSSLAGSTFRLEFFLNSVTDLSPQGRTLLGAVQVTTDANGNLLTATALTAGVSVGTVNTGTNTVSVTLPVPAGTLTGSLTSTATALTVGSGTGGTVGDTSEFSAPAALI